MEKIINIIGTFLLITLTAFVFILMVTFLHDFILPCDWRWLPTERCETPRTSDIGE